MRFLAFPGLSVFEKGATSSYVFITSVRGKEENGGGKGNANGLRNVLKRDSATRISGLIYEEIQVVLKVFLENVIRDAVTDTEHGKRRMVTSTNVVYALKPQGRTLSGFGA
ncbi:hypothetical protein P7K49_007173 [Saguinus oedipus]|uniref:Histone H4 n=1 Tax=Saguinus oedipus TaxID=9490 RepID=A0ABQ9VU68_SAGOE|nr:hypothetical protein P7K49_007173 [Saguinus oedipus]